MQDRRSLLAAGAAATVATPFAASAQAAGSVATMRFAMRGLQPLTTVFVGKNGPYLVLIDTGNAVACTLKAEICDRLDLQRTGSARVYGATGTDTQTGYLAHDVTFGQTLFEKDVTFLGSPGKAGQGIDGILPLALFTARPTDIDFAAGEVRIQIQGAVNRTGFRALHTEAVRQSGGHFVVQAMIEGLPARLVVDTGASTTVALDPGFVRRHGLWDKHPRYIQSRFGGITGTLGTQRRIRTPEVQISAYTFKDVVISLADPAMTVASDIDGLLGVELLRRFTVGFDRPAASLWLKPNDALADPFIYDLSGLTIVFAGGSTTVLTAAPGSPSQAAGLKPGDRIVGLDTPEKVVAFDNRHYRNLDQEISFEIERDGQRIPIKMVLKDWL